jgi:hypothetical protein
MTVVAIAEVATVVVGTDMPPNPALNFTPFGHWTLREKAVQRRLALRWAS